MAHKNESHTVRNVLAQYQSEILRVPGLVIPIVNPEIISAHFGPMHAPVAHGSVSIIAAFVDGHMVADNIQEHWLRYVIDIQKRSRGQKASAATVDGPVNQLSGNSLLATQLAHRNLARVAEFTGNTEIIIPVTAQFERYRDRLSEVSYNDLKHFEEKRKVVHDLVHIANDTLQLFAQQ